MGNCNAGCDELSKGCWGTAGAPNRNEGDWQGLQKRCSEPRVGSARFRENLQPGREEELRGDRLRRGGVTKAVLPLWSLVGSGER